MKKYMAFFLVAFFGWTEAHATAPTIAVCDDCGVQERRYAAIQAAPIGGNVLVYDFTNNVVKKYFVTFFEEYDGAAWTYVATHVSTSAPERDDFYMTKDFYDHLLVSLQSCGPGSIGNLGYLDGPYGTFQPACDAHDLCYAYGGDEFARGVCDNDLFGDLLTAMGPVVGSYRVALAYWLAVRVGGWRWFNYDGGSGGGGGGGGSGGSPVPYTPPFGSVAGWQPCTGPSCYAIFIVQDGIMRPLVVISQ